VSHSPAGGSSAKRVISCPGSVGLIASLPFSGVDEESDDASRGTAAHAAAAVCLEKGQDAWEVIADSFGGVRLDPDDAVAIQVYLDEIRSRGHVGRVEEPFAAPELHRWMYGTIDHHFIGDAHLDIDDYKHGVGVVVEAEGNEQAMYYAALVISKYPEVRTVRIGIHQPRAYHPDGATRYWETTAEHIMQWVHETLLPRMREAESGAGEFAPGEHCRFCPAKLYCQAALDKFEDVVAAPLEMAEVSDEQLGEMWAGVAVARMMIKAISGEVERRMKDGRKIDGAKWVRQKADRIWRDDAEQTLARALGKVIYSAPKLLSPAQVEKLPGGADLVKEYAFKPETGTVIAPVADKRKEVAYEAPSAAFAHLAAKFS
jgi:hypothetical protein